MKAITVYQQGMENKSEEILLEAKQLLEKEKANYTTLSIPRSNPAKALQNIAKQEEFNLIVAGSRALGNTASLLLGSVSRQVVVDAECNILIAKKMT